MSDETNSRSEGEADEATRPARGTKDRRRGDRRSTDRRTPVPVWRSPGAYVAYGVVGALFLGLLWRGMAGDEEEPPIAAFQEPVERKDVVDSTFVATPSREAYTLGDYERLVADGQAAVGQVVSAQLYCGPIRSMSMRKVDTPTPVLTALADGEGRVPGAECRWTREDRSAAFLLIVPPYLAEDFARMPEEEINFIRQRVVPADVEWLGRSDALSLRIAGVLRGLR